MSDSGLRLAVLEIDGARAEQGWDQPAALYALVDTGRLVEHEPELAARIGLGPDDRGLTAIEQEPLAEDAVLEDVLSGIEWPPEVDGCAAVVERLVLPPSVSDQLPDDDAELRAFAAGHPERQDVRITAAVLRDGTAHCALRVRGHDEPGDVVEDPDLVPALVALLADTLDGGLRG